MMRRRSFAVALWLTATLSAALAQTSRQPDGFAITGVTIIDVNASSVAGALKANQTVVVTGDRIAEVGATDRTGVPSGLRRIDARGKFLIPGLWDMHAHVMNEERIEYFPLLLIANGVTGIRDMGAALPPAGIRQIRSSIDRGDTMGPRIAAVANTILEGPRGRTAGPFLLVTTAAEAKAAVDRHKSEGADFIKVYNGLTRETYLAIIDEARRVGLPVTGHIPASMSASEVSKLGQRTIEHSGSALSTPAELLMSCSTDEAALRKAWEELGRYSGPPQGLFPFIEGIYRATELRAAATYDDRKATALFADFVRNGTWQVPTLVVDAPVLADATTLGANPRLKYIRASTREQWQQQRDQRQRMDATGGVEAWKPRVARRRRLIGDMHRSGVSLLAGTDVSVPELVPGFSLHDELALLVSAGLSPFDALRSATANPARFLNATDRFGAIERGKIADLVLLDANPLQDIARTQRINAVITNGRYLSRSALDDMLLEIERIASRPPRQ